MDKDRRQTADLGVGSVRQGSSLALRLHMSHVAATGRRQCLLLFAVDPDEEEFVIMKKDQKDFVDKITSDMCDKDACMWSYIGTPIAEARPARLRGIGRKTLILELFCGVVTFSLLASQAGWPISQPPDVMLDGLDLTKMSCRDITDQQIERNDPFVLVMCFCVVHGIHGRCSMHRRAISWHSALILIGASTYRC